MTVAMLLVSCKDSNNEEGKTTDASVTPPTSQTTLFDPTEMKSRHESEEKIMYILCWNAEHTEFEVTEDQVTVDEVNASVYERDNQVKNTLGIKAIQYNAQIGSTGKEEDFVKYVETAAQNGDVPVDIIATYSKTAGMLAQKGFYLPLNHYDKYIDFSQAWYPEQLIEEMRIKDNLYFVSGDISTNLLFLTYSFIFNKELMTARGIDYNDYYKLAEEGKWTLEEMYKLCDYYEDANSNGKKDIDDSFGLRTYFYHVDAVYTGANLKLVEIDHNTEDPDKLVIISPDYGSSKAVDLNDALGSFFTSDNAYADSENVAKKFGETRKSIAMITRVRDIGSHINTLENKLEVGILPIPKYDENQEDYRCVAGNPFTLWGIYSGNMDLEREESAVGFIEYMGYFASQNTTEAVFEDNFLGRYADQPDDANVFTEIRRTTAFDIGRVFAKVVTPGSTIIDQWTKCAVTGGKWTTIYRANAPAYAANAKIASKDFWKLNEELKNPYEFPYEN